MKALFLIIFSIALAVDSVQSQTLLTETTWGGVGSDVAEAVASGADGSSYVAGITDSFTSDPFGIPSPKIFVVKFAPDGSLTWQRIWNGTTIRGLGRPDVAVSADGSIYVTGITADNGNDAVLLKFNSSGDLVFDRQFDGRVSETGEGVAIAPDNTIYVAGTTTTFGASNQDAFVLHVQPTGKKILDALTWGGTGFETGAGVAVNGGTLTLAATTNTPPPYSLLPASAKLSAPRGRLAVAEGVLADVAGVVANPAAGTTTPPGSTTFGGNFEAALVRIAR